MSVTYAICNECKKMNRVQLGTKKEPICGACKAKLPVHGAVVEGADSTLQTLIERSPLPVVVDVWAPWCGPCRAFALTFEEFSERFSGKVVFVKLNSDQYQKVAGKWGIRGVPTILVFKEGNEVARQSGAIPGSQFGQWINQFCK